jgi:hypothetical protein
MGLKSRIANRVLNARLSNVSREKQIFNLDTAQTVGILWEADLNESFIRVENELYLSGIKTSSLCYFPQKKAVIPEGIHGFTRKETSWWAEIPNSEKVEDFIKQKFDILIDLTGQRYFPVVYITALSEANFKIGYSGSSTNYFDLNIEFSEQPEPIQLADQILYYLNRINKTTIE